MKPFEACVLLLYVETLKDLDGKESNEGIFQAGIKNAVDSNNGNPNRVVTFKVSSVPEEMDQNGQQIKPKRDMLSMKPVDAADSENIIKACREAGLTVLMSPQGEIVIQDDLRSDKIKLIGPALDKFKTAKEATKPQEPPKPVEV